jgi:transcriptional regulator GlxA family with amidase domain
MEVLRLLRLDRAAQLLTRTDLAVQEVADLVGFEDAFHFSRLFRAEFGHAPREFRQGSLLGQICPESREMARKIRALPRL